MSTDFDESHNMLDKRPSLVRHSFSGPVYHSDTAHHSHHDGFSMSVPMEDSAIVQYHQQHQIQQHQMQQHTHVQNTSGFQTVAQRLEDNVEMSQVGAQSAETFMQHSSSAYAATPWNTPDMVGMVHSVPCQPIASTQQAGYFVQQQLARRNTQVYPYPHLQPNYSDGFTDAHAYAMHLTRRASESDALQRTRGVPMHYQSVHHTPSFDMNMALQPIHEYTHEIRHNVDDSAAYVSPTELSGSCMQDPTAPSSIHSSPSEDVPLMAYALQNRARHPGFAMSSMYEQASLSSTDTSPALSTPSDRSAEANKVVSTTARGYMLSEALARGALNNSLCEDLATVTFDAVSFLLYSFFSDTDGLGLVQVAPARAMSEQEIMQSSSMTTQHATHSIRLILKPIDDADIADNSKRSAAGPARNQKIINSFVPLDPRAVSPAPTTSRTAGHPYASIMQTAPVPPTFARSGSSSSDKAHGSIQSASTASRAPTPPENVPAIPIYQIAEPAGRKVVTTANPAVLNAKPTDKLFKCGFEGCLRAFKRHEHLRRHERAHTQEKPYQCDFAGCGRYFSRSDNLTQHVGGIYPRTIRAVSSYRQS